MLTFPASIPPIASAILVGGGEGDSTKIKLECNLTGNQLEQLAGYRGKPLMVTIYEEGELANANPTKVAGKNS